MAMFTSLSLNMEGIGALFLSVKLSQSVCSLLPCFAGGAAAALKMYLNETFTTLKLDDVSIWMKVSRDRYTLTRHSPH